jgi:hypothetical protein
LLSPARVGDRLSAGCDAIDDDLERKRCQSAARYRARVVAKANKVAIKDAFKACRTCCRSGGPGPCEFTAVLCGDGVLGGGEACDGDDDRACPGRCEADCACGPSVDGAFMSRQRSAL